MITIRPAAAADRALLADLLMDCHTHYWGTSRRPMATMEATADALIDGTGGCTAVVAWIDGVPRGFATITRLYPALSEHGTLFMKDLYVTAAARNTGLGEAIMAYLARLAVELGCQRFDWTAESHNPGALRFYDRIGADRVEEKVYFRFTGDDLAAMAARAGSAAREAGE